MDYSPTIGEIGLISWVIITQLIPWFLRTFFPAVWSEKIERRRSADEAKREEEQYRREAAQREFDLKREMAQNELLMKKELGEKELELRREIAERDTIIEARNSKAMEVMERNINSLTAAVGEMILKFNIQAAEQHAFFNEGRKTHQLIEQVVKTKTVKKKKG